MKKLFIIIFILIISGCNNMFILNDTNGRLIKPDNKNIKYYGRVYFDNETLLFDWPGVGIEMKFKGKGISILLDDGNNDYNIFIDGKLKKILHTEKNITKYDIAKNLKYKEHTILIAKRTESLYGIAKFKGFIVYPAKKVKIFPINKKHRKKIEFIGNSITCGYGNESKKHNCSEKEKRMYENNYLSYAVIAATKLNYEYSVIAISGVGLVRNYGEKTKTSKYPFLYFYEKTLKNKNLKWNFKKWIPDIVVINLGTNDFSTKPYPDKTLFIKRYKKLINIVKRNYNNPDIYCLCGPYFKNILCPIIKNIAKEESVNFLELPDLTPGENSGCDWHPSVNGHKKMAKVLIKKLKEK